MGFFRFAVIASLAYIVHYAHGYFTYSSMEKEIDLMLGRVPPPDSSIPYPALPDSSQPQEDDPSDSPYYPSRKAERAYLRELMKDGEARFANMLALNDDFWGTVEIPGIMSALPFVQGRDNDYYLYRNIEKKNDAFGVVFMDWRNDPLLMDRNTLLYAHHMRSGKMFGALTRAYKQKNQASLNNLQRSHILELDSLTGKTSWIIFSAYTCEMSAGYTDIGKDKKAFDSMIKDMRSRSSFNCDLEVTPDDRIITLSTCDYVSSLADARFVVHARRLRPHEKMPKVTFSLNQKQKAYKIPDQKNLSEIPARQTTVGYSASTGKTYYYQKTSKDRIVYYVGPGNSVQGPYPMPGDIFVDDPRNFSWLSTLTLPGGNTYFASGGIGYEKGIYLLSSLRPDREMSLVKQAPITPSGQDAHWPLLAMEGDTPWLLYTVKESKGQAIHRVRLDGRHAEKLLTVDGSLRLRPIGFAVNDGVSLLVFHDIDKKKVFTARKGLEIPIPTPLPKTKGDEKKAKGDAKKNEFKITEEYAIDPEPLSLDGTADRITLHKGSVRNVWRVAVEKNGVISFRSSLNPLDIMKLPPPTPEPKKDKKKVPKPKPSPKPKPTPKPKKPNPSPKPTVNPPVQTVIPPTKMPETPPPSPTSSSSAE